MHMHRFINWCNLVKLFEKARADEGPKELQVTRRGHIVVPGSTVCTEQTGLQEECARSNSTCTVSIHYPADSAPSSKAGEPTHSS
eukprot:1139524-Pelagomonas_calceolata.AAC.25